MWAANVAIAGNFDVEIHCFPKRVDQTVKKASDGGANETKERWIYDATIENKTFVIPSESRGISYLVRV